MYAFRTASKLAVKASAAGAASKRALRTTAIAQELTKFQMPAMSPTMTEGGIASWKKKEGEAYSAGDVLLEIETDKATMDVEAQDDGIMAKIIVGDGSKAVKVGTVIAVTAEEGDDLSGADALAAEGSSSSSSSEQPPAESKSEATSSDKVQKEVDSAPKDAPSATPTLGTPGDQSYGAGGGGRDAQKAPAQDGGDKPKFFASPLARKLALERGIPLSQVKGTGPEGRIVKADIEKFKGASTSGGQSSEVAKTPTSGVSTLPGNAPPVAPADYEDLPISNMRRTIGKRLLESKTQVPHYYLTVEVNMDRVQKLRQMFNKAAGEGKPKLSVNDFIVKASALALAEVPEANSAWLGDVIRQYKKADICVAVATPNGLITPIVKDVGSKGLATISSEVKALAGKARDGKLKPEEYQGGTFTISNLGMFGIQEFNAIINPPQSCILAIGATVDKVVPAPEDPKGFKVVQVMSASLSADHRTVDGAVGSRWLKAFKDYMEQPLTFML
ncbi:hypothetical protein NliqN6_3524 [Naganishia liquefaciens]|uniref:Acetyltransferase component of pyruvate dehydrogenase complex n=1 Tax=Naganishia liquefaciens TaxID=104408 RepID=A0A8H3TTY8_9TREE|nr:hypothetical protein NliqN6_3524 [Naganishia liquefaciens]